MYIFVSLQLLRRWNGRRHGNDNADDFLATRAAQTEHGQTTETLHSQQNAEAVSLQVWIGVLFAKSVKYVSEQRALSKACNNFRGPGNLFLNRSTLASPKRTRCKVVICSFDSCGFLVSAGTKGTSVPPSFWVELTCRGLISTRSTRTVPQTTYLTSRWVSCKLFRLQIITTEGTPACSQSPFVTICREQFLLVEQSKVVLLVNLNWIHRASVFQVLEVWRPWLCSKTNTKWTCL